jgi:hypothetical protein
MGRGPELAVIGILALSLGLPVASALEGELLVNEDRLERGQPGVVHAVVDVGGTDGAEAWEVHLSIDGPGSDEQIVEQRNALPSSGSRLVTLAWTPAQAGNHTLQAAAVVGGDRHVIDNGRTVWVSPGRSSSSSGPSAGVLPHTAPGTVQWAIAFGILFFFARAGLDRQR